MTFFDSWVLVLVFFAHGASGTDYPMGITSIPDFSSQKKCFARGLEAMEYLERSSGNVRLRYYCIRAGE